ncbi:transposase (plasmid) [Piscirickettsia salmonis]|uniref:transposase n=1 Tax=Piscirickettsia salmonis TaxID=1238 RepID=UPI00137C03FA|nr:transposase [Piscirickettsia salmonis]QHS31114.1 transposase [Piscirickettsia salmonis]
MAPRKYKISAKRSWRKLHVAVDDDHYIQAALITDRYEADEEVVDELLEQIDEPLIASLQTEPTIAMMFTIPFKPLT